MSQTESPLPPGPDASDPVPPGIDLDSLSGDELKGLVEAALDRMPLEGLIGVIDAAQSRRHAKQEEAREILLTEFRERAEKMGMSLETLFPHLTKQGSRRPRRDAGQPLAPKYRGPTGETWSGRGIPPRWLSTLEAEGRNREEFRIKEE